MGGSSLSRVARSIKHDGVAARADKPIRKELREACAEMRDRRRADHGKALWVYRQVVRRMSEFLDWPHELTRGGAPFGSIQFETRRFFQKKNLGYEDSYFHGRTDRLWAWRMLYREQWKSLVSMVASRVRPNGDHNMVSLGEVCRVLDEIGLPVKEISEARDV